jgi:hypothetical protein
VRSSGFQPLCPSHRLQSVCDAAILRDLAAWCGRRSVGLSAFNQSLVQVQHATSAETRQSKPKAASLDSSAKPGTRFLSSKQQDFSRSCHRVCFPRNLPSLKNYIGSAKSFFRTKRKEKRITQSASANRHRHRHRQHQKPYAEHHPSDHCADHGHGIFPQRSYPAKVASQAEPKKKTKHEG